MPTSVKICPECGEVNRTWQEHCRACQTLLIDEPVIYKDIPALRETKGDEEGTVTRNSTGKKEIIEGMTQVLELTVRLGNYYKAHPSPENKILVECAALLGAYNQALEYIIHSSTYGEAEIRKLIELLEPHDRNEAALLQKNLLLIRHIVLPQGREEARQDYASRLMEILNMTVGTGRLYLLSREMKERGISDVEINRAIESTKPQNPF